MSQLFLPPPLDRYYAMEKDTLYLVSNQSNARKTSTLELQWLAYESYKRQQPIRTAFSDPNGQVRVKDWYLDGYLATPAQKTAFEFLVIEYIICFPNINNVCTKKK